MKTTFSKSLRFVIVFGAALWLEGAEAETLALTNITMVSATPQFAVQSDLGITNQIQYCTNLSQGWWLALTNVVVTESPYWFVDVAAPPSPQRFYRARVVGPTPSGMALVPVGSFTMGNCMDPNEGNTNELPLHTVYVSAFYMETNLVTFSLYTNVFAWANSYDYRFTSQWVGAKDTNCPVMNVEWYDAALWCNARSEMEGLTPCYYTNASLSQATIYRTGQFDLTADWGNWTANGYRLPTEAEWEKAARGGAIGHRFPWSDADTIDWSRANYYAAPTNYSYDVNPTNGLNPVWAYGVPNSPVGSFAPNGYGLCDMAGNAFEWCWDWSSFTYYSSSPGADPRGPVPSPDNLARVTRGGNWAYPAKYARCASRFETGPANWGGSFQFGFRCVRGL